MTVSYKDLFHLNLSHLDGALETWDQRIRRMREVESDYGREVAKPFRQAGWNSSDGSSSRATKKNKEILKEIGDALKVARTVRNAIHDASVELRVKKKALHDLVDHELPKKFKVTSTGKVTVREGHSATDNPPADADDASLVRAAQRENEEAAKWQSRINSILDAADEADVQATQILTYALTGGKDFRSSPGALSPGIGHPEQEKPAAVQADSAPFGSKTIKPAAEFLSYRPWINSGSALIRGHFKEAYDYFWGGVPSYVGGKASSAANDGWPGATGKHRKLSPLNKVGVVGAKIFDWPVAVGATIVDYAYTPESDPAVKEQQSRTLAPGAPPRKVK